ncbi:MAG: acetolactate synthase large subunit, partial [Clostridia bacterium]|nr:acetolactate synthase large subunit [Clostridia bacterium]
LGAFPASDPNFTGMIGMHGTKTTSLAISQCDLLIAVGARFSDRVTCNTATFAKGAKILHIDADRAEIDKNVKTTHSIVGDAKL